MRRSPLPDVAAADRVHSRWCRWCAGQTAITDATIWAAVEECQAESATFDCPASQATYGPIEDWDVGAVTSLNNCGAGCARSCTSGLAYECGRASPIHFDVPDLFAFDSSSGAAVFYQCSDFNRDLSRWDVSSVTNMIGGASCLPFL